MASNGPVFNAVRAFLRHTVLYQRADGRAFSLNQVKDTVTIMKLVAKCPTLLQRLALTCNKKLNILGEVFAKQCNAIAVQRIRRTAQMINLYNKLYDERSLRIIVAQFGQSFLRHAKGQPLYFLFGATLFSWQKDGVSDGDIDKCVDDMDHVIANIQSLDASTKTNNTKNSPNNNNGHYMDGWEKIIDKPKIQAWRKPIPDSYLYEYKIYGSFNDIPARAFFNVQLDLEYRKQWDKLVISLDTVERDNKTGSEIIHWIMQYPFPMYSRDFVYVRRAKIDVENKVMVLISRSVAHPSVPENNKYVRVKIYSSQMVIKPHSAFDENGFDYILTYCDDPQAAFPTAAYNWMACSGVPDFVDKLHNAAKDLNDRRSKVYSRPSQSSEGDESVSRACYS